MVSLPTSLALVLSSFGCSSGISSEKFPDVLNPISGEGEGEGEIVSGEGEGDVSPPTGEGEGEGEIGLEGEGEEIGEIAPGEGEGEGEGGMEPDPEIPEPVFLEPNWNWAEADDCDLADMIVDDPHPFMQLHLLCQGKIKGCELLQGLDNSACEDVAELDPTLTFRVHSRLNGSLSALSFDDADGLPGVLVWLRQSHWIRGGVTLRTNDILSGGGVVAFAANSAFGAAVFDNRLWLATRDAMEGEGYRAGRIWNFPILPQGILNLSDVDESSFLRTGGRQALQFAQHGGETFVVSAGSREADRVQPAAIDRLVRGEGEENVHLEPQGEPLGVALDPLKKFEVGGPDTSSVLLASGGDLLVRHLDTGGQQMIPVSEEGTIVAAEWHPDSASGVAFVATSNKQLFTVRPDAMPPVSEPVFLEGLPVALDHSNLPFLGCFLYVAQRTDAGGTLVSAIPCEVLTRQNGPR